MVDGKVRFLSLTIALSGALVPVSVAAAASPMCAGERATIVGTDFPDKLTGTKRDDVIVARGGADRIESRGGDDIICGGGDSDRIHGGPGDDRILGQGDSCWQGDPGSVCYYYGDKLSGGAGDDTIIGGGQRGRRRTPDVVSFRNATRGVMVDLAADISSGQGLDTLVGIGDAVTTPYDDLVFGSRGQTETRGGDDTVTTSAGSRSLLITGDGDDTIRIGAGGWVKGGRGDDVVEVMATGRASRDAAVRRAPRTLVQTGRGDDVVEGSEHVEDVITYLGNDEVRLRGGNDQVRDGPGASLIEGGEGRDQIEGGRGNDTYDGGPGTDEISYGRLHDDRGLVLDLATGSVTGISGLDALAGFERHFGSPQADTISGDDGANVLVGFDGDLLYGRGGDDTLELRFDHPDVTGLVYDGGGDRDLLLLLGYFGGDKSTIDLATGQITGMGTASLVGIEDVTDNFGHHTLIGDDEPNVLNGGGGRDRLEGRGGDDTLVGGGGRDTGDGGAGADTCDTETKIACEE